MKPYKSSARILGSLFILVMVCWSAGYILIESLISVPDFLETLHASRIKVIAGVLFELLEVAAIMGIVAMLFPIIKNYDQKLAVGYAAFRILESVMLICIALAALLLLSLSKAYAHSIVPQADYYGTLSNLIMSLRMEWSHFILAIFYGLAAMILHIVLYRVRLVPRFIPVWGFLSAVLVIFVAPFEALEIKGTWFAGISMGLNELFLGVWLIVKGFDSAVIVKGFSNTKTDK